MPHFTYKLSSAKVQRICAHTMFALFVLAAGFLIAAGTVHGETTTKWYPADATIKSAVVNEVCELSARDDIRCTVFYTIELALRRPIDKDLPIMCRIGKYMGEVPEVNTTVPVWTNPQPDNIVALGNVNVPTEDTCAAQFRFSKPNVLPVILFCIGMTLLSLIIVPFALLIANNLMESYRGRTER